MGSVHETPYWVDDIYRIQVTDPVLAGQDGIVNIQPTQIASRTLWLKNFLLKQHNPDGSHSLTNESFSEDASIPEKRLILDCPTEELHSELCDLETSSDKLREELELIVGQSGYMLQSLAKVLRLNWRYGLWGAEFEFFQPDLIMRDFWNQRAKRAIGSDDSVDVENNKVMRPGMTLLLSDGSMRREVRVRSVLDRNRIRLTEDLPDTFERVATIGFTDWRDGKAANGEVYISKTLRVLEDCGLGSLYICRNDNDAELKVEFRDTEADGAWEIVPITQSFSEGDLVIHSYQIRALAPVVRITALGGEVDVKWLAVFPEPYWVMPSPVRTPVLLQPDFHKQVYAEFIAFDSSDFYSAYRDYFVQTEYEILDPITLERQSFVYSRSRDFVVSELKLKSGDYLVRCRHQSDIGDWSLWSEPRKINITGTRKLFGFDGASDAKPFGSGEFDSAGIHPLEFGFEGVRFCGGFDEAEFCDELREEKK